MVNVAMKADSDVLLLGGCGFDSVASLSSDQDEK